MKKTTKAPKSQSLRLKNNYSLALKMAGIDYSTQGKSVEEALGALGLTWEKIKAKGVVTVTKGPKTYEHLFLQKQLKRIFANKLTRMMWGKRLELLLGEQLIETASMSD